MRLRHLPSFRRIRRQAAPGLINDGRVSFKSLNSLEFVFPDGGDVAAHPVGRVQRLVPAMWHRLMRFVPQVGEKFP